jgi:transposase-like protein
MHRRKWETKTKAMIVMQGLQGKPVAVICNDYQISQLPYDQWRDQVLAHASNAFKVQQHCWQEVRLAQENARLKKLVGELPLERKKSDELWGCDASGLSTSSNVTTSCGHASGRSQPSPRVGGTAGAGPTCVMSSSARSTRSGFCA